MQAVVRSRNTRRRHQLLKLFASIVLLHFGHQWIAQGPINGLVFLGTKRIEKRITTAEQHKTELGHSASILCHTGDFLQQDDRGSRTCQAQAKGTEPPNNEFTGILMYSIYMFIAGALLGPVLDGVGHGNFGVLTYHTPSPFVVGIAGFQLFRTASWVPGLFGVAGLLIGGLYWILDDALSSPRSSQWSSVTWTLQAVACFAANYIASGFLWSHGMGAGPLALILAVWALACWWFFDGTTAGLMIAVLTAIGGPLLEVGLVNAPWWDLYAYNQADFYGVDSWIPWVYLCGAPAVGCVARLVRSKVSLRS